LNLQNNQKITEKALEYLEGLQRLVNYELFFYFVKKKIKKENVFLY
jgi:hypothetical protein